VTHQIIGDMPEISHLHCIYPISLAKHSLTHATFHTVGRQQITC